MRTTVNINDSLLELAKQLAHERQMTLGEFLQESIQVNCMRRETVMKSEYKPLPVFKGRFDFSVYKGDFTKTPDTSYVDANGLWHE